MQINLQEEEDIEPAKVCNLIALEAGKKENKN